MTDLPELPELPDLAALIAHEHRVIDGLLATLATDRQDRLPLAHRLVDELAAHTTAELQIFLPALRDIVPGGAAMANAQQADHERIRSAMNLVLDSYPGEPGFEAALTEITAYMAEHVPLAENNHLPALKNVIGSDALTQLGMIYTQVKETIPSGVQGLPPADQNPKFSL